MSMSDAQSQAFSSATDRFTTTPRFGEPSTATGANSDPGAIALANGKSQQAQTVTPLVIRDA
jgi:hypothetical protein